MPDNSGLLTAALQASNPELAASIDADNSWKPSIKKRAARVKLFREYEAGDHRADITTEMRKMLRLNSDDTGMNEFNNNYMRVIIDKMASRLFVASLKIGESKNAWLDAMLKHNSFDAKQSSWYRSSIRDGDAYVMIDPYTLAWTSEPAYDGFSGIVTIFDPLTTEIIWAAKMWSEADLTILPEDDESVTQMKIIVYEPHQISYYTGKAGTEYVKEDGPTKVWELGTVPLIHFANNADNYSVHGESELRPAIPLQDVLNRTLHSMVMASEFSAFSLLWSIGFEVKVDSIVPGSIINLVLKDDSGNIITDMTQEQVDFLKAAKVGQFKASDLGQYTHQITEIVKQISQATQTPIYGVQAASTAGNLSGEALKQLEIGLLGKIERYQRQNNDKIIRLIDLTAQMQNTFANDFPIAASSTEDLAVTWKPAEMLDVNLRIKTLVELREKAPGLFSDEFYIKNVGSLLDLSQEEIEKEQSAAAQTKFLTFDDYSTPGNAEPFQPQPQPVEEEEEVE